MSDVDVQIYLSQIKTFFNENPKELYTLIGDSPADNFFDAVYDMALVNHREGNDIQLIQKQMIEVILKLNTVKSKKEFTVTMESKFGKIYLN